MLDPPLAKPSIDTAIVQELGPSDPSMWEPNNFTEWERREKVRVFLAAWTVQMSEERTLRTLYAKLIFSLVSFEVVAAFALLVLIGLSILKLDSDVLKVLFTALLGQIFGLAYLVTKYLFSQPLRHSISDWIKDERNN
jgi:hypothetical protein